MGDTVVKTEMNHRLRRIEGQIRGVQNMVDEDRDCREIVQQLAAIRSAVQGATAMFVQKYVSDCVADMGQMDPAAREKQISELVTMLGKTS